MTEITLMLSRVADNLYWMSRYLERAEHMARLLDVNLYASLDQNPEGDEVRWPLVLRSMGVPPVGSTESEFLDQVQSLIFDASNRYSIVSHVAAARNNAREVRELISSPMWEQMNRLHHYVTGTGASTPSDTRTYEFLQLIRRGSHLFHGIASSTMSRGDGWSILQLGRYLERVISTVSLLDEHLRRRGPAALGRRRGAEDYIEWVNLLQSCSALEAYCRIHTANIVPEKAAAFLLLDADFPHSIRFGIEMIEESLSRLSASSVMLQKSPVHRSLGKLRSSLGFDLIEEIYARDMSAFLRDIRSRCYEVDGALYAACIAYPIDQALAG